MRKRKLCLRIIAMGMFVAACKQESKPTVGASAEATGSTKAGNAASVTDQWIGQWNGPEGTFIVLTKNGNGFTVKIQSLDGPAIYEGAAVGDHIEFVRDGKKESIRAGNGIDTGMKWLMGEKNCLVIKKSEGFCR